MSAVEWADHINCAAPKQSDATRQIDAIVRELRANPGRAARVKTNVAYGISDRNAYKRRGCLVVMRRSTIGSGWDHFASWPAPPAIAEPAALTSVRSSFEAFRSAGERALKAVAA